MKRFKPTLFVSLLISSAAFVFNINAALAQSSAAAPSPCVVSESDFSKWFKSGTQSKNGLVTFADSLGFTATSNCDFYKWGQQMFLWVSSPVSGGGYGPGGGIVLDTPTFYDVDLSGNESLIPNGPGANIFPLRTTKPEKIFPGGQAGGGDTLLSLNGSLVYFGVEVNDVYAWFNRLESSGTKSFPTTPADLLSVTNYAKSNGVILHDANALTMEFKTAWVDATKVAKENYITIQASVPNYVANKDNSTWTIGNPKSVLKTLALVGIHVVGSVKGHPEMIWATFEHKNNAPNNDFYSTVDGKVTLSPYQSTGSWTFMQSGGTKAGALIPQMTVDGKTGNIVAKNTPPGIVPNNVYRAAPWGSLPHTQDPATVSNNDQLISLNNNINGMLSKLKDVRANYFQVGAVWTDNGAVPTNSNDTAIQRGSLQLANTTMETYHQGTYASSNSSNSSISFKTGQNGCFECHNLFLSSRSNSSYPSVLASHIFPVGNTGLAPSSASASSSPSK